MLVGFHQLGLEEHERVDLREWYGRVELECAERIKDQLCDARHSGDGLQDGAEVWYLA